ncbi:MAG TPA: Holliday junction resolvase RuvX [Syntrophorhabdaceae bacterium]|nr:Holliday junction resolvase RuvX [Syntrophorhabdaceae bacterium]HPU30262.1 Holliday junction resolvase RuvX [Syntrophorhabdaceae bacterium]
MRILCLDVGEKRIGISLSDPTGSIAQGLTVLNRVSLKKDMEYLEKILRDYEIGELVVGLPKDLNGSIGKKAKEVLDFVDNLKRYINIPVILWDERFTTNEAHRIFSMAGMAQKKRKPFIDIMSAQIILQGYLDAKKTV